MNFSITKQIFKYIIDSPQCLCYGSLDFKYRSIPNYSLGFILPKSIGLASDRNRFKRRCRTLVNNIIADKSLPVFGLIVRPKSIEINYKNLNYAFDKLSNDIKENIK